MARVHQGPVGFDATSGELLRDGRPVALQGQPRLVLAYLVANAGRTVSREELIGHVWHDGRHVQFDQGLNYCVRQVRIALGDDAANPRYLATNGRTGYRWIGPVPGAPPGRDRVPVGSALTRPVPAWLVAASTAAASVFTMVLTRQGLPPAGYGALASNTLWREAIHQLHVLSHAAFDPGRAADATAALHALWAITARALGASS